ncbi:MAG TPA: Ldh family oxidoreductase [Verrucomicrobiae bacterium]|nr:Ldh family oxidoreductase [Verrucomicrobiae bacterium]
MAKEIRIQPAQLVDVIHRALTEAGLPERVASTEAEIMAEADLCGVPSHGIRMLPELLRGLQDGRVTANPHVKIIRERPASCLLDGDNGPGRFVSWQAMRQAMERGKRGGIGACLVRRVGHWGRAHAYAYRAAQADMIAICMTNAIPNMLAWESKSALLGNNPLAIAVPRGAGREPIVLDLAMSQAAIGKIGTYLREGKKAPWNWGLDPRGKPSNDPAVILAAKKVLPFGQHKGAGLALMIELLTAALSGGLLSNEMARADSTGLDSGSSKLFITLDIWAFVDATEFNHRIDDLLAWLQHAEPGLKILLPGDRGWQMREKYHAEGVPIHGDIVRELKAAGIRLEAK